MANAKKDSKGRKLRENESQMPDGRYRYRYTDKDCKRKAVYSWRLVPADKMPTGKRQDLSLREKELAIEKDLQDGISSMGKSITVNEQFLNYLDSKAKLAVTTRNNYFHLWEKHIKDNPIGHAFIANVKKSDILKFYKHLSEDLGFSNGTIQLYQNILYPAFDLAVEDDLIRKNPCKNCMKDYAQGSLSSNKKAIPREEQIALMRYIQSDATYSVYYPMFVLMLGTGCRIGEALGLTWNDINFEEQYVDINHQAIYKKKDDYFVKPYKMF